MHGMQFRSGVSVPCLKQSVPALMTEPDALSNGRNFRIKLQGWQHKSKHLPLVIHIKSVTFEKVWFSQDLHALTDNRYLRGSFLMCIYWTDWLARWFMARQRLVVCYIFEGAVGFNWHNAPLWQLRAWQLGLPMSSRVKRVQTHFIQAT